MKNKKLYLKILYLVFIFFVGALAGGLIEILYQIITVGSFRVGGFMYGPFRPIYGWGCILLHLIGKRVNKNIFITFISSFIICSVFEYLSSYALEMLFGHLWWDYSDFLININGRVCLSISLCWGLLGVAFTSVIEPFLSRVYNKVNKENLLIILIIVFIIYAIDSTLSIINHLNYVTI